MEKLYPPYINGTIPAFYYSEGATKIVVPFTMNRAVQADDVAGFALKIKNISGDVKSVERKVVSSDITSSNASVTFSSEETFIVGQYYKAQLAYISKNGVIGYYSTVGIIKCTTKPAVSIEGLVFGQANMNKYSYTGVYSQYGGDATEKMYSYRFLLTDVNGNIVMDSGEKIHSTSLDDLPYESHETFNIKKEFDSNTTYYLQFITTTINKLTVASTKYRLVPNKTVPADINVELNAIMDFNNGYTLLTMTPLDESNAVVSGNFVLCRASDKDNYAWEEIQRFDFHAQSLEDWKYKDFTIEQGRIYKYSLQQYNSQGIYSNRIESEKVTADFEDMFLFDGEKQLRIRYNPKVSSFKTTLLEVKTDTIGSKYPFFSRNGNVEYKEFAISGLLSYFVDEDENFISMQDLGLDAFFNKDDPFGKYRTTNLLDYNIMAERIFKNRVLDWLNDGQVKLFKSPAEGNFLVRLMNISLTPMDQLSRMLHTFNATAYEVADFNSDNLVYYGFINPEENLETNTGFKTVNIASAVQAYLQQTGKSLSDAIGDEVILTTQPASLINIQDALPGSYFYINTEKIQIGTTGAYSYSASGEDVVGNISYVIGPVNEGQITYGYKTRAISLFGTVQDIQMIDYPDRQFIGREYLNRCRVWNSSGSTFEESSNLLDMIRDVRTTVLTLNAIKAERRHVEYVYCQDVIESLDNYSSVPLFWDENCEKAVDWSTVNPLDIFRVRIIPSTGPYDSVNGYKYYVDANYNDFSTITDICIDGNTKEVFTWDENLFKIQINDEIMDLSDSIPYTLSSQSGITIDYLEPQQGVVVDLMYVVQIQTFIVEVDKNNKYATLQSARNDYLNEQYEMIKARKTGAYDAIVLKDKYDVYLYELNKALDNYKEENGLVE